ncbi:hypothetical protein NEOLEDRAFT_652371 [Neolentinus lepideus HHB14362 ss-1]|uniref:Uncharacterized protein n=1 Tax=Neolentinus lepideus HHB14362 ss-1 TaxID=1314782 RepID=A0A165QJQ1_9AGAM|nr:hypothetical protein NEOLEDRAFT_652371 [Neolentinus lepideus HHB14362 ss-1]
MVISVYSPVRPSRLSQLTESDRALLNAITGPTPRVRGTDHGEERRDPEEGWVMINGSPLLEEELAECQFILESRSRRPSPLQRLLIWLRAKLRRTNHPRGAPVAESRNPWKFVNLRMPRVWRRGPGQYEYES